MKSKIKSINKSGENQWQGKTLTKWFVMFEDESNGTLTTGFDESPAPVEGDELEYEIIDKGFGKEIKTARKGGGGGFKATKWEPGQVAQNDAVRILCAALEGGMPVSEWMSFFAEAKEFLLAQIKVDRDSLPF